MSDRFNYCSFLFSSLLPALLPAVLLRLLNCGTGKSEDILLIFPGNAFVEMVLNVQKENQFWIFSSATVTHAILPVNYPSYFMSHFC